jgi:hypothetical protein
VESVKKKRVKRESFALLFIAFNKIKKNPPPHIGLFMTRHRRHTALED